jgi:hypothetical protein
MAEETAGSIAQETLLSLAQVAKRLPPNRNDRPVSLSCVLRWILSGVRTPRGRVRVEGIRLGGRWLTSVEALERFIAAQTPDLSQPPAPLPRSPAARRRASERAAAELERLGI